MSATDSIRRSRVRTAIPHLSSGMSSVGFSKISALHKISIKYHLCDLLAPSLRTLRLFGVAVHMCSTGDVIHKHYRLNKRYSFMSCYHFVVTIVLFLNFVRLSLSNLVEPKAAIEKWGNFFATFKGSPTVSVVNSITFTGVCSILSIIFNVFSWTRIGFYKRLHERFEEVQKDRSEGDICDDRWSKGFRNTQTLLLVIFVSLTMLFTTSQIFLSAAAFNSSTGTILPYVWFVMNCIGALGTSAIWCLSLHWFLLLGLLIRIKYNDINRVMDESFDDHDFRVSPIAFITDVMRHHYRVTTLCQEMDAFMKYYVAAIVTVHTPLFCFLIFQFMWVPMELMSKFITGFWTIGLAIYQCILLFSAAAIPYNAQKISLKLYGITLVPMKAEQKLTIVSGMTSLMSENYGFTFLNMFVINNSAILNTFSAVVSYIIIISQQLENQTK